MANTAPRPDEPRPLDDRERRLLSEIDHALTQADPALAADLRSDLDQRKAPRGGVADRVVAVLAVLVVLGFLLPVGWFVALVLITVTAAPFLWLSAAQRAGSDGDS